MSVVRIHRNPLGKIVSTSKVRGEGPKTGKSQSFNYDGDDTHFEQRREAKKRVARSELDDYFNQLEIHATNGFRGLLEEEKPLTISRKKIGAMRILTNAGCFQKKDLTNLFYEVDKRVDEIYSSS